jgi:hypothetical protein
MSSVSAGAEEQVPVLKDDWDRGHGANVSARRRFDRDFDHSHLDVDSGVARSSSG